MREEDHVFIVAWSLKHTHSLQTGFNQGGGTLGISTERNKPEVLRPTTNFGQPLNVTRDCVGTLQRVSGTLILTDKDRSCTAR